MEELNTNTHNNFSYELKHFFKKTGLAVPTAILLLMAVVTLAVAFISVQRRNVSLNPNEGTGASNASCYLALSRLIPSTSPTPPTKTGTPSPRPSATPSPSASPLACQICNYQIDAFWGPVIDNFAGGLRYQNSPYRLINSFDDKTRGHVACPLAPVTPETSLPVPTPLSKCDRPIYYGYLTANFSTWNPSVPPGYTVATITNTTSTCTYTVGAASYKVAWTTTTQPPTTSEYATQNLFDSKVVTLGPKSSVSILVKVPSVDPKPICYSTPAPTP